MSSISAACVSGSVSASDLSLCHWLALQRPLIILLALRDFFLNHFNHLLREAWTCIWNIPNYWKVNNISFTTHNVKFMKIHWRTTMFLRIAFYAVTRWGAARPSGGHLTSSHSLFLLSPPWKSLHPLPFSCSLSHSHPPTNLPLSGPHIFSFPSFPSSGSVYPGKLWCNYTGQATRVGPVVSWGTLKD